MRALRAFFLSFAASFAFVGAGRGFTLRMRRALDAENGLVQSIRWPLELKMIDKYLALPQHVLVRADAERSMVVDFNGVEATNASFAES